MEARIQTGALPAVGWSVLFGGLVDGVSSGITSDAILVDVEGETPIRFSLCTEKNSIPAVEFRHFAKLNASLPTLCRKTEVDHRAGIADSNCCLVACNGGRIWSVSIKLNVCNCISARELNADLPVTSEDVPNTGESRVALIRHDQVETSDWQEKHHPYSYGDPFDSSLHFFTERYMWWHGGARLIERSERGSLSAVATHDVFGLLGFIRFDARESGNITVN